MMTQLPGHSIPAQAGNTAARKQRPAPPTRFQAKSILWEALFVALIGTVFAFAANEISPRGLSFTRDYFPGGKHTALPGVATIPLPPRSAHTNATVSATEQSLAARLQANGLQLVTSDQVAQLFRDPRYEQGSVVFVDARNDLNYQQGHIPGAVQFDHYRAEHYLATVLPVCQAAEQVVVYCTGGDCEDSEFAAIFLRQAGVLPEKLFVYAGGMTEWTANGLPVEIGARNSGNLRSDKP
jgi:rhodanese-related sulfurtransferase